MSPPISMRKVNATTAHPSAVTRLSRAQLRRRWLQMIEDPLRAAIPYKVELNEKGTVEVSPASNRHGILQASIASELRARRPDGTTIVACSVETRIGVRAPDVAWASAAFIAQHGMTTPLPNAPKICIAVVSPSNTPAE